ncbi:MAG TPA: tetratricopeptide repeat protein [Kofleriaceae bacterium]|nr:tetratricopeptide repeat protein [Kofleriaceae bacterium]
MIILASGKGMSEDTLPHSLDPLEARVVGFRQHPEARKFAELRQQLRDAGRGELLADVCATWAQHERDPVRAADAWSEAGEAMSVLGEMATAVEYLRTALELDPANDRAADRLIEIVEPGDPAAAVEIIELELGELAKREGNRKRPELIARRAAKHRRAAELWNDHLGRVDRALWHWQQAWRLEPQRTEALEAARQLYMSLGDDAMVAKLYQAELDVLGNAPSAAPRKARIRYELGVLALRNGDLEAAANHLEEAQKLEPTSLEIAEKLAEVYASPGFRDGETRHKAGQLFVEVGRRRLAARDDSTGINYLRRAVGIDPYSKGSSQALEQALSEASQWQELDRILRHRSAVVTEPAERAEVLRRRAALYRNQLPDRAGLIEVLTELVAYEQPGSKATRELRELLREDQDWESLSRLMEAEINALGQDPSTPGDVLVNEMLELATIAREHMNDRDRAAELLHQALGVMPTHEEALARYVEHFRERRDWRGLIDLCEFALDNIKEAGAPPDEIVRRLEEIAQLAELRLGDIPRAIEAWQRIAEYEPGSGKVAEALRRLTARGKMWEQLVTSLEAEVASAHDQTQRTTVIKKMAQTYRERQIDPRRAIELYEQLVTDNPNDDHTLKALMELYEREGDDAGMASALKRMIELEERRVVDQMQRAGKSTEGAKEWPVAKRAERLTQLRRLAVLYETRLADVDGVVFACSAVLELLPGDRDALERMERVLAKAGDPRLEKTLEYHAQASSSPAERAKILKRLAKLATEREDDVVALERWEQTLRASPADPDALAALADLYDRSQRWGELAQILERMDGGKPLPAQGTPEAAVRAVALERYATVLDVHLGDGPRAIKAWHRVLELTPKNRTALEALARLYRTSSKWRELSDVLGWQVHLYAQSVIADDREKACAASLERAEILENRLGAPGDAIKVLDQLIHELNPNHLDAHTALRRLHEARGDFDAAVRVAEREMYLSPEPARKVARGLEIGLICRDRLNNPTRALQAFKRVLELEPEQDEALAAAADLLARLGRWKEHVALLERMLAFAPGRDDPNVPPEDAVQWAEHRRSLVQRIAAATADKLGDPKGAFRWWRRAHDEAPDEQTLADVRRAGEAYGLWRELAEVLTDERKRLISMGVAVERTTASGIIRSGVSSEGGSVAIMPSEPERFVALSRELAGLCERRLGDKTRALAVLAEALAVSPRDRSLLGELERIASEVDQRQAWRSVLDAYELAFAAAPPAERVELYLVRAKILEEKVRDPKAAVSDLLSAFSWAPDREDVREALVVLAGKARAWNEVVSVDSALVERAPTAQRRVELLRRKAAVIEEHLKDAPRAFRTHLVALLLAPDDADTTSHLWRLARVIGKYRDADRTPAAEPPPATVQTEPAFAEAIAVSVRAKHPSSPPPVGSRPLPGVAPLPGVTPAENRPRIPKRFNTEPIEIDEVLAVGDTTQPIDVDEVELAAREEAKRKQFASENATMTLSPSDLKTMMVPPRLSPGSKPPPKPPPRPPQIRRTGAPPPSPVPRKAQAAVRRPPLPTLPNRPFESPWEELALAYESLPAPDTVARLRWLYRAAEVWETGAHDIPRAFDALARAFAQARRGPGGDQEVRARLHRIAQEHRAWDRLADLYEGMAEEADTAVAAADLLMEVANIRAEQKKPREAEAQLRRILGMLPNDSASRARLEELYRSEGRWVELAASLEERTDPRLGTAAPQGERSQLLRELAHLYTEKLQRPHDAIDALERLRQIASDSDVLFQLASLYGLVGRWSKVIETLARVVEVAEGSAEERDALHQIGRIYIQELELPERAIEAYVQLVEKWPDDQDAWAALDKLYTDSARWEELADVLRRRAALSREPTERAQLLARRAQVLVEWLNAPEEAAAALRHARTIAPEDAALGDQLVGTLVKAGKDREAAAILEGRILALTDGEAGASRGDLAALHIRLAQLRHEKLDDRDGARAAIEHALALVPEHPTALAVLADLASPDEDPRTFVETKLREAESARDDDTRIAALMAAGDVLHTRVGDIAAASATYQRVLALRPYHSEATWALAGLVEKGGDPETAMQILEKRLEDESLTPPEKARIMTQLAALSRLAGVEPAAERRLLEALGCVPDHIPAIVALADFYADAGRWQDLEMFLREVLDGTLDPQHTPGALIADLHRRLANAYEKLGRDEDAYQTLVTADRMHRGHLLIKLALGENRYKARRWREAALHLSPLAAHEDAERYPSEVAQGLYHAALAEIRSLRPEKAPPLYARALELKPNYGPALQALAEIAMEQGDHRRAADLLTRQATATETPEERMKLFEALGDMATLLLKDEERARTCYAAAVNAAQPLEARHIPLLEKTLDLQQRANDLVGSGRTLELMAAFGTTPADRATRYIRAARDYLAGGDRERARAAAERGVEADPYDVDAVDLASQLAIELGEVEAAAAMLTRLLTAKDDRFSSSDAESRRSLLSFRLGQARQQRGDMRQAIPAYEQAIQLAPTSEGATHARRALVELVKSTDEPARRDSVTSHLQAIAAATGALPDLLAWADELRRQDRGDAGRAAIELAIACGHTPDVHQTAFLSIHKPHVMRDDEPYRAVLDPTERQLLTDPAEATLSPIASALSEAAALLWPDLDEAFARMNVIGARRIPATLHIPATAMFPRITTVLGAGPVMLYQTDHGDDDITVVGAATPVIVLGPRLTSPDTPAAEARALVARAVELTRPEHLAFAGLPEIGATRLLASIARLFGPQPLRDASAFLVDDPDIQRGHDDMVKAALSVKIRTRLEQLLANVPASALDVEVYLAACHRTADRAALLLGGDPKTIAQLCRARDEAFNHLISAAAHQAWLPLKQKLGVTKS